MDINTIVLIVILVVILYAMITNNQAKKNINMLSFFHYLEGLVYEIEKIKKIEKLNIKLLK